MKPPQVQFTLRTIFLATLWMAVGCGGVIANRTIATAWDSRDLELLRKCLMFVTFYIGVMPPFIAVGVLFGRATTGAVIGFIAISSLLAAVSSLVLFIPAANQSPGETSERITDCAMSYLLLVTGIGGALLWRKKLPRFQFTLRSILLATFWMAVGCGAFVAAQSVPPHSPYTLWHAQMWATFYIAIASPFIAVGVLLGRAKVGAVIGILATSALVAVMSLQLLFDAGIKASKRYEWLTMGALHGVAAAVGFTVLYFWHRKYSSKRQPAD